MINNEISPDDKLNGLKELSIYKRALRRCRWFEYYKRKVIKEHIDLIKYIYEI